jgi:hypothetical protein
MKARIITAVALVAVCAALAGCSSKEKDARERERIELEEQSRRETQAANKAITEMNRKLFGRKPAAKPADAPAAAQPKPEEKMTDSEPAK